MNAAILVSEVGPRDGLQSIERIMPLEAKKAWITAEAAAGVRLAAFLVAAGLILGRSVGGDWISAEATVADFAAAAWPALILVAVAALLERWLRPTPDNPRPSVSAYGLIPALLYLSLAFYQISRAGTVA